MSFCLGNTGAGSRGQRRSPGAPLLPYSVFAHRAREERANKRHRARLVVPSDAVKLREKGRWRICTTLYPRDRPPGWLRRARGTQERADIHCRPPGRSSSPRLRPPPLQIPYPRCGCRLTLPKVPGFGNNGTTGISGTQRKPMPSARSGTSLRGWCRPYRWCKRGNRWYRPYHRATVVPSPGKTERQVDGNIKIIRFVPGKSHRHLREAPEVSPAAFSSCRTVHPAVKTHGETARSRTTGANRTGIPSRSHPALGRDCHLFQHGFYPFCVLKVS